METTLHLSTILQQEDLSLEAYQAVKELAFAGTASLNRLLELLVGIEDQAESDGNVAAHAVKLGMCYLLLGNQEKAAQWLERADDSSKRSYFLGWTFMDQGRYDSAAMQFEGAARQGWDQIECDCLRAECLALLGDHDSAEGVLERNATAGETSAQWHYANGRLAEQRGEFYQAIDHYEDALDHDDSHVHTLFHLAYLLDLYGSDERAMDLYRTCADAPFVHANVLTNLALIFEDEGEFDKAAECLRRVLAVDPNNARARLYLKDVSAAGEMYIDEQQVKEKEKRDAVLDIPVSDFELSVRSRNCLKKMNIHTLGDLLRATESELLAYKNFGETSLKEIKAMLEQKGLALGQYADDQGAVSPIPSIVEEGNAEILSSPVSELKLSVRSRKCLQRLGIATIGELVIKTENELLESKNFGQTSLSEIKGRLTEMNLALRSVG